MDVECNAVGSGDLNFERECDIQNRHVFNPAKQIMPCVCAAISDAIAVVNESSKLATVVFCTYDWRIVLLLFHVKLQSLALDEKERKRERKAKNKRNENSSKRCECTCR